MHPRLMVPRLNAANLGVPSFEALFGDAGSGVVTTAARTRSSAIEGSFLRATSAWTILSNGTWGLVAAGSPRSYYTPSGVYKGFFSELTSTNLCLRSQDFAATWTDIGTPTLVSNTTVLGAMSLSTLGDDDAGVAEGKRQIINFTADAQKAVAVTVKKGTSNSSVIKLVDVTAPADRLLATITWSGSVPVVTMTTGTNLTGTPEQNAATGAYRLSFLTTSVTAANSNQLQIYPGASAGLNPAITGTIEIGGVQVENAVTPTSYIPTVASTVQRIGDQLTYSTAVQMPCSVYAEVYNTFVNARAQRLHWMNCSLISGASGYALERDDTTTPPPFSSIVKDAASFPGDSQVGTQLQGATNKIAAYFDLNDVLSYMDGVVGAQDVVSPVVTGLEAITVAAAPISEGNQQQPNGCIKTFRIWNRKLTNLVALTSP